tara:strand:+ start:482 stop:1279 length:798 start_codon:yes stop_codon:yes gene_type:complete
MNHLEKILTEQISRLNNFKSIYPIDLLKEKIKSYNNFIDFKEKLKKEKNKISVIAEMKKASPSAGIIIKDYKPIEIAENYLTNGSSCLSILTEEKFFHGKLEHILEVKKKVKLPVLMKDFFTDDYQVYLAKASGADAILIILSAIYDSRVEEIYEKANELNLTTIVEVHNEQEAKKALKYNEAIIGINNRDLSTLETDINTTYKLHEILSNHKQPLICESGIKSEKDVEEIVKKTGINNFLIGESLLKNIGKKSSLLRKITQITA